MLEPLSGYLLLAGSMMGGDGQRVAGPWNFGPQSGATTTVEELATALVDRWGRGSVVCNRDARQPHEATLLSLDCSKAATRLGWRPAWDFDQTVRATVEWYKAHHEGRPDMACLTDRQIDHYEAASHVRMRSGEVKPASRIAA